LQDHGEETEFLFMRCKEGIRNMPGDAVDFRLAGGEDGFDLLVHAGGICQVQAPRVGFAEQVVEHGVDRGAGAFWNVHEQDRTHIRRRPLRGVRHGAGWRRQTKNSL
jgi:hypothetical protein